MQRFIPYNLACFALMLAAPSALAADTATLRLSDLPAGARVYVDGKLASIADNAVVLTPGGHEIQIEALNDKGAIVAHRFTVQATAGKTEGIAVHLFPVQLAPWWPYRRAKEPVYEFLPAPPGGRGPEGEPGSKGRPYTSWSGEPTDAMILQTLKAALLLRLDALQAQAEDAAVTLALRPAREYIFNSGKIRFEPPGPSGSPGAQGVEGLPANTFALEDSQGHSLLNQAVQQMQFGQIEQAVLSTRRRGEQFARAGSAYSPLLRLLTPAWSTRLEKDREAVRQAVLAAPHYTGTICPAGAMGLPGSHGAKGADGVLPANAAKVRVSVSRAQRLLALLQADPELTAHIQWLQTQTDKTRKDMDAAQISPMLSSGTNF